MKKLIVYLLPLIVLLSCKKEEGNDPLPEISDIPNIELTNINSTNINQFDDIIFDVKYVDGDGDLGETDADVKTIFVTDNRDASIVHEFHLQPLAPLDESFAIQGTLKVNIENVILLNQANTSENASFSIYIKDRAGNKSNTISSSSIKIMK